MLRGPISWHSFSAVVRHENSYTNACTHGFKTHHSFVRSVPVPYMSVCGVERVPRISTMPAVVQARGTDSEGSILLLRSLKALITAGQRSNGYEELGRMLSGCVA
jgi:hypothetical protein